MGIEDVISFANANKVAYIATLEGNQPRVHPIDMWKADSTGFYFHNNASLGVYQAMKGANRKVELHFAGANPKEALRVTGEAEVLMDPKYAMDYYNSPRGQGMKTRGKAAIPVGETMFRVPHGEAWLRPAGGKRSGASVEIVKF